ncbi:MAG: hypothetical protein Tsb009_14420 [Planctomycetaceae bacterium]
MKPVSRHLLRVLLTVPGVMTFLLGLETTVHAQRNVLAQRTAKLEVHQKRQQSLERDFQKKLLSIADKLLAQGEPQNAKSVRDLARKVTFDIHRIEPLPHNIRKPLSLNLPARERAWRSDVRRAQSDYANQLFSLSRRALHDGLVSYAYRLIREVARHDSDHPAARRLLGYVRYNDRWVTPFEKSKLMRREVWHPKFGWLPEAHVENYNKGLRYYQPKNSRRGRWITADRDATLHADFRTPWIIRTEHYLIKTNHSLERGVEIATKLEDYYQFFFQTFAGFFNSREQMRKLFSGTSRRSSRDSRPYLIHYYKTKDEYVKALIRTIPQIEITNGLYLTDPRTAYFFHNPAVTTDHTLYHEATHQIFYESLPTRRLIAHQANFWIVEGIACYMESFRRKGNSFSLGDPNYPRFVAAKYRYVTSRYYVPLQKFAQMGMRDFQNDPNIKPNYSQASGLAKFFMEYDGGRYRDALIEHLSQIYRAGSRRFLRVQSLAALTGVPYKTLDEQYGKFIQNMKTDRAIPGTR